MWELLVQLVTASKGWRKVMFSVSSHPGGTYLGRGGYLPWLGEGYLLWPGGTYLDWGGYLPWLEGTCLGWGVPCWYRSLTKMHIKHKVIKIVIPLAIGIRERAGEKIFSSGQGIGMESCQTDSCQGILSQQFF